MNRLFLALCSCAASVYGFGLVNMPRSIAKLDKSITNPLASSIYDYAYSVLQLIDMPAADKTLLTVSSSGGTTVHTVVCSGTSVVFRTGAAATLTLTGVQPGDPLLVFFGIRLEFAFVNLINLKTFSSQFSTFPAILTKTEYFSTVKADLGSTHFYSLTGWFEVDDPLKIAMLGMVKGKAVLNVRYDQQLQDEGQASPIAYHTSPSATDMLDPAENVFDGSNKVTFYQFFVDIAFGNRLTHTLIRPGLDFPSYSIVAKVKVQASLADWLKVLDDQGTTIFRLSFDQALTITLDYRTTASLKQITAAGKIRLGHIVDIGIHVQSTSLAGSSSRIYLSVDSDYVGWAEYAGQNSLKENSKIIFNRDTLFDNAALLRVYSLRIFEGGLMWKTTKETDTCSVSIWSEDPAERSKCIECSMTKHLTIDGDCTDCGSNEYNNTEIGYCSTCNPNCAICTNHNTCGGCKDGYFFKQSTATCQLCHSNCVKCVDSWRKCTECIPKKFLDSASVCRYANESTEAIIVNGEVTRCSPDCLGCEGMSYYCKACNIHTHLPHFLKDPNNGLLTYLSCAHRKTDVGDIRKSAPLMSDAVNMFFPTLGPLFSKQTVKDVLYHKDYTRKLVRGWVKLKKDIVTGKLHAGRHTIVRITQRSDNELGDDYKQIEHNIFMMFVEYDSATDKVEFYAHFSTGTKSVGSGTYNLHKLKSKSGNILQSTSITERWIYVGGKIDWETGKYYAFVIYEMYDPITGNLKVGDELKQFIDILEVNIAGVNYFGGLLNDIGFLTTNFYIRFGGFGKTGDYGDELEDDQAMYFKSWVIENSGAAEASYFVNRAIGRETADLYFRLSPIEHQWWSQSGDTFVLTDDSPNFHQLQVNNAKKNARLVGWVGSASPSFNEGLSIRPPALVSYSAGDYRQSLYFNSSFKLPVGTPYLLIFFYKPPGLSGTFPPNPLDEVVMRGFTLRCRGCINRRPEVLIRFKVSRSKGAQVQLQVALGLPDRIWSSPWIPLVGNRMLALSYERMTYSEFVTYKLFSSFSVIATYSAKVQLTGHTSSTTAGDVAADFDFVIGDDRPTGEEPLFGTIRNVSIFLHTSIQTVCEPGCQYCTKNSDCLAVTDDVTYSLYDFKVHVGGCPKNTAIMQCTDPLTRYCSDFNDFKMMIYRDSLINVDPLLASNSPSLDFHPKQSVYHHDCQVSQDNSDSYIKCTKRSPTSSKTLQYVLMLPYARLPSNWKLSAIGVGGYGLEMFVYEGTASFSYDTQVQVFNATTNQTETVTITTTHEAHKYSWQLSDVSNAEDLIIFVQVENVGSNARRCPPMYTDVSNPQDPASEKQCEPINEYKKKCHPLCADCYGFAGLMDYCISCNLLVAEQIWTTSEKTQFICVPKSYIPQNQLQNGDIFECSNPSITNIPLVSFTEYNPQSHPITCLPTASAGPFALPSAPVFTYRSSLFIGVAPGDYVCPFNCNWMKLMSKYVSICLNNVHFMLRSKGKFRCCRYGNTDVDCFITCYDQPGSYPYNNQICKNCPDPSYAKVSQVALDGEPLDAVCVPLSSCREYNSTLRICYDCPPGYIGINIRTLAFKCEKCDYKFFDATTLSFVCLSSCNKYPYYYYNTVKKECEKCPAGLFFDPTTSQCESTCLAPKIKLEDTYCADCTDPIMKFKSKQCSSKCTATQYSAYIGLIETCVNACPPHLYQNSTSKKCQSCEFPLFLMDGVCQIGVCPEGRFLNEFNECNPCNPRCVACQARADLCTSCPPGSGKSLLNKNSICYLCGIECVGCDTNFYKNCTNCSPPFTSYFDPTSQVNYCKLNLCQPGTILHQSTGLNQCAPCSFKYPGCAYCNVLSCDYCSKEHQPIYQYTNNQKEAGTYFTQCKPCKAGPDKHPHFFMEKASSKCLDVCGDGVRYNTVQAPGLLSYLECDDGNLIDGDGCDSNCKIEANYHCSGGSFDKPDTCTHLMILECKITHVNDADMVFTIEFNDQNSYNKPIDHIMNVTVEGLVQSTDFAFEIQKTVIDNKQAIKLKLIAYVSIVDRTVSIYIDNLNVMGSKQQLLKTSNLRYHVQTHIRTTAYDRILFSVFSKGSTYILLLLTTSTLVFSPLSMPLYFNSLFHSLLVFLLPIDFDASTSLIVRSFLHPLLAFDYFQRIDLKAQDRVPARYRDIGLASNFVVNGLFPLMMVLLSFVFTQFVRVQVRGQLVQKKTSSRFKVFFFFAHERMYLAGHMMVLKTFYPQLLFSSMVTIMYFDSSQSVFGLLLPACTFIYCLSVIVQFFMTFTYHIAEAKPSKTDIEEMRFRRSLLMDSGYEKRQLRLPEAEEQVDEDSMRLRAEVSGSEIDQKKAFYGRLDFFGAYKRKVEKLSKRTVQDYGIESLKFDKKYRLLVADYRVESFWARLNGLFELLYSTLYVCTIVLMSGYVFVQLTLLMSLELGFILYVWRVRVYNNKKSLVYALTNRAASLVMLSICTVLAVDSKQQMMSKYSRYRIVDRGVLQHILVLMILFNSCFSVYMFKDRFVKVYRFFFDKKYHAVLNSMLYASTHSDFNLKKEAKS